jgi:D-alanyl-D-alanine carboxypeptidase
MKQFGLFFLALFFLDGNSSAQLKDDYSAKIDGLINTTSPRSFNGIIWITKKGETKYLKTYGYSNFETKTHFTLKDNFRIQSMSKQITAAIVLREVEKGKIELYVPTCLMLSKLGQIL